MNERTLDDFAARTAQDILERHAPDCLHRHALRDAIARLARLGLEGHLRLFQTRQEHPPDMEGSFLQR
jgi:hypothetical protein